MPRAHVLLRAGLTYRRGAFEHGLARLGFEIVHEPLIKPEPGDLLVLWNRKPPEERIARAYEQAGATVVIAENGYIGRAADGGKLYALALNHHNGRGTWPEGDPERWDRLGVDLSPWRAAGEFILVLPQRGIGEGGVAMPATWTQGALNRLAARTRRPVRIRRHPGVEKVEPNVAFPGAWCAVTWGSGAAIKAIAAGVPVFHDLAGWIGAPAAQFGADPIEAPWMGDRLPMFRRLAWAQWSMEELESGEAFAHLLQRSPAPCL